MKKSKVFVLLAAVLILVLLAAVLLYPKLAEGYSRQETSAYQPEPDRESGEQAPSFEVLDANGNPVVLTDCFGKPIIINFWATWCQYCVLELPAFDACAAEYEDEVTFLMVDLTDGSRETMEKAGKFAKEQGFTFPIFYDTQGSAAESYQVQSIPMTVFIAADGTVYDIYTGAMGESTLRSYIAQLTGEGES